MSLSFIRKTKKVGRYWSALFECSYCGRHCEKLLHNGVKGKSCGCLAKRLNMGDDPSLLIGKQYGVQRVTRVIEKGKCLATTNYEVTCQRCGSKSARRGSSVGTSGLKSCIKCKGNGKEFSLSAHLTSSNPTHVGPSPYTGKKIRMVAQCETCGEKRTVAKYDSATSCSKCGQPKGNLAWSWRNYALGEDLGNGHTYLKEDGFNDKGNRLVVVKCAVCAEDYSVQPHLCRNNKSCGCQRFLGTDTIVGFADQSGRFALKEEVSVYLYSFENGGEKHFKVGITNNMRARKANLQKPSQGVGVPVTLEWESVFGSRTEAFAVEWNALAEAKTAHPSSVGRIDYFEGAMECFVGNAEDFIPVLNYLKDRLEEIGPARLVLESGADLSDTVRNKLEKTDW